MGDVRLDNICSLELEQLAIFVWRVHTLASGKGNAERCDGLRHRDSGYGVEPSMHLEEDLDLRSHRISHCRDQFDRAVCFGLRQLVEARTERVNLEGAIAALDNAACCAVKVVSRALDCVPAIGIRRDTFTHGATK